MDKNKTKKKATSNSIDILLPLKKLSKRFQFTLFFVVIVACLVGGIMLINNALKDIDPNYTSPISAGSIDQDTLNRINALHTSAQGSPAPTLPAGRINPVGE